MLTFEKFKKQRKRKYNKTIYWENIESKMVLRNIEKKVHKNNRGKLRFEEEGNIYTVEEIAIKFYEKSGYYALGTENHYWERIINLLFHKQMTVEYYKIRYEANREEFEKRFKRLEDIDLEKEIEKSFKYHDMGFLMSGNWDSVYEYGLNDYLTALRIGKEKLLIFIKRLVKNGIYGLPDLIVWNDNEFFFVEVKSENDNVSGNQLIQHLFIMEIVGIKVELFCVNKTDSQMKNLKRLYDFI